MQLSSVLVAMLLAYQPLAASAVPTEKHRSGHDIEHSSADGRHHSEHDVEHLSADSKHKSGPNNEHSSSEGRHHSGHDNEHSSAGGRHHSGSVIMHDATQPGGSKHPEAIRPPTEGYHEPIKNTTAPYEMDANTKHPSTYTHDLYEPFSECRVTRPQPGWTDDFFIVGANFSDVELGEWGIGLLNRLKKSCGPLGDTVQNWKFAYWWQIDEPILWDWVASGRFSPINNNHKKCFADVLVEMGDADAQCTGGDHPRFKFHRVGWPEGRNGR